MNPDSALNSAANPALPRTELQRPQTFLMQQMVGDLFVCVNDLC